MKSLIYGLLALILSAPFIGYGQDSELKLYQKVFDKEKRELFEGFISADAQESSILWPLYDAYEVERKMLGDRRIKLLQDYINDYDDLSNNQISEMVKEMQQIKKNSLKLENKYFKKIQKATNANIAGQFLQFEDYILTLLRAEIFEAIDFIE